MQVFLIVWLTILTIVLVYVLSVVAKLFAIKDRGLKQAINESIDGNKKLKNELLVLKDVFEKHQTQAQSHFQKTALVRFNPFERLGGEQSYCLAILNQKNHGVVITFLYTKEGVRVYVKEVEQGRARNVDLSKEEKEAIVRATTAPTSL